MWLYLAGFFIGLLAGTLFDILIYRIPQGIPVLSPLTCERCGRRVLLRDVIPLVSLVTARGRTGCCGSRLGNRGIVVSSITGLSYSLVVGTIGLEVKALFPLALVSILIIVAGVDINYRVIPNSMVITAMLAGVVIMLVCRPLTWASATLGFLFAGGLMISLAVVSRGGMGAGDLKLAAVIGFYLGWPNTALALLLAFVTGAIAAFLLIGFRLKTRHDLIPFGPFLATGAFVSMFWGKPIISLYLRFIGDTSILGGFW